MGSPLHHDDTAAYSKVAKEVDQVKLMILDLRANQAGVDLQRPDPRDGFLRRPKKHNSLALPHYSLAEI